jgi:hypothetical protein
MTPIKVTVEGIEGLKLTRAILTFWPETKAEFDAIVERVGGTSAFHHFGGTYASAEVDGAVVQLNAPKGERWSSRPIAPSIRTLQDAAA